jgi:hypothetical protein
MEAFNFPGNNSDSTLSNKYSILLSCPGLSLSFTSHFVSEVYNMLKNSIGLNSIIKNINHYWTLETPPMDQEIMSFNKSINSLTESLYTYFLSKFAASRQSFSTQSSAPSASIPISPHYQKLEFDESQYVNTPIIDLDCSILAILLTRFKSPKYLSTKYINLYRDVISHLIQQAETAFNTNDMAKFDHFLMAKALLPMVVFSVYTVSKPNDKSIISIVKERLNLVREDNWSSLTISSLCLAKDDYILRNKINNNSQTADNFSIFSACEKKAIALISKAEYKKAFNTLFPSNPANISEQVINNLVSLHPKRSESNNIPQTLFSTDKSLNIVISPELFRRVVTDKDNLIAPGLDKNRIDHIKQLIGYETDYVSQSCCESLAKLSTFIANGILPHNYKRFLNLILLFALDASSPERPFKIRPIAQAAEERKIAGTCLLRLHAEKISEVFNKVQYGVGTTNGCEKVIHTLRVGQQLHPDWDLLDLDFMNAYNQIVRLATAHGLQQKLPALLNYFETFYNDKAPLILPDRLTSNIYVLLSEEGAQQGDPEGSLYFSIGVQSIFEEMDTLAKPGFVMSIIDDNNTFGPHDQVVNVLDYISNNGPNIGLKLQHDKTKILLP